MPVNHADLVDNLRALRVKGLVGLRTVRLRELLDAAVACGLARPATAGPAAVETLLRHAAEELGGGRLGEAATYTFGLAPGTRDWPAQDRRRRSAEIYAVSTDRFRKHYERLVLEQTADAILRLCERAASSPAAAMGAGEGAPVRIGPRHVVSVPVGGRTARITVHTCSVEMLSAIDVIVSSENTHYELAHTFKTSLSACLRRAASTKGPSGEVVDDTLVRELASWIARHGRTGLAVAPGTVAPTSSGELAHRGVVRIYHAAVAVPRSGTNEYDVDPATVSLAAANVFELMRTERAHFPDLTSVCLPLFGAGRGGLPELVSFSWIWAAVADELARDDRWQVHFVARTPSTSQLIVDALRTSEINASVG